MAFFREENLRFWIPAVLLAGFGIYSSQMMIRAHVDPKVAAKDYNLTYSISASRGSVYSMLPDAAPYAKSVPYWEYRMDPQAIEEAAAVIKKGKQVRSEAEILRTIADVLPGIDYRKVVSMYMNRANRYQFLALSPDRHIHEVLSDRKQVAGVAIRDRQVRQYLHGRSLCHVIGAINAEQTGVGGIEQRFEKDLSGTPGVVHGYKDARGREIYNKRTISVEPISGNDIYLTIEPNIQNETEKALKDGLEEFGAGSGWAIVMDARSGAIRAMASLPDFDPLLYRKASDSAKLNRAIAFTYEPGSVMKVITAAAAIDSAPNKYNAGTVFKTARNEPNYYQLPGDGTHVWEPTMTLKEAIVHSSNIVIGKLAYDLGPNLLYDYFRRFGFGERTGIELPGEEVGIVRNPRRHAWDLKTRSRAGIGQGVAVTALQLISAYQAIANNGVRVKPYIVEKMVDGFGNEIYHHQREILGVPITPKTARTLRDMMLPVASKAGTARRAAMSGYSIAGKTGTAQKVIGRSYAPGLYRATFCGMLPASDPELVILVTLDFDQRTLYHQGGNSAAPIFRRIAEYAVRYLEIDPDRPDEIFDTNDPEI